MAKVSLRAYNREIEAMIDRGHLDEAVAHCQHILKIFPKHLETYRLLGKAYLEARQHNEAVDVFSRVLNAEPSDFVAHVGMSIIRDEQNKLDDAIWHMERAFEVQSANSAIQGELQRLYGRRDGVQPPRIRMTRGALAHMYLRGELYPQAISEIKSLFLEDPGRSDMQVLLSKAYYRSGQKKDAADAASAVLKRYPYCLAANLVLAEVLGTDRPESAQTYRRRVIELDPYAAQAPDNMFQAAEVSDAAVSIDHLEWNGQPVGMSADWGTERAIALESGVRDRDAQPDWLKASSPSEMPPALSAPQFDTEQEASAQPEEEIPDFLRAAGWGAATGAFDESKASIFDNEPTSSSEPIAQGDLPDWVKAMAPQATSQPAEEPEEEMPDWINKIGTKDLPVPASPAASSDNQPDWLSGSGESSFSTSADQPDWLEGIGKKEELPASQSSDESLDWLSGSGVSANQPDWLDGLGEEQQPEFQTSDEQPDWLKNLGQDQQSIPVAEEQAKPDWMTGFEQEEQPTPTSEDQIDWLKDFGSVLDTESPQDSKVDTRSLGTTEDEQDDSFAWLENLAAKQGATEGLLTKPEERLEEEPDWVRQAKSLNQPADQRSVDVTPPVPVPQPAANVDDLGKSGEEIDDALAWFEGLAAKQGATEGLLTKPEDRNQQEPDWIRQARSAATQQTVAEQKPAVQSPVPQSPAGEESKPAPAVEPSANAEDLGKSGEEIDDALAWFEGLAAKQGATEGLLTKPEERRDQEPDWIKKVKSSDPSQQQSVPAQQPPVAEQPPVEKTEPATPASQPSANVEDLGKSGQEIDDALAWFESLAVKQGATEGLLTKPEERSEQEPEWVKQVKKSTGELQSAPARQAPIHEDEVIPEPEPAVAESAPVDDVASWLKGLDDEEETQEPAPAAEDDTASWLKSLDEPEQEPITFDSAADELPGWMKGIGEEEAPETEPAVPMEEAEVADEVPVLAEESAAEDVPAWLSGLDEEEQTSSVVQGAEDLPAWMRDETGEVVAEPMKIEPTRSADWKPVDEKKAQEVEPVQSAPQPVPPPKAEPKPEPKSAPKAKKSAPKKEEIKPAAPPEPYKDPVTRRGTGMLTMPVDPILGSARAELSRSNIPGALETYEKLIKKGRFLEEVIYDLREALYRYPVEVSIWQTLGDAYMRANQLQDALDAYTKAEELLR